MCEHFCVLAISIQNSNCVSLSSISSNTPLDSYHFQTINDWRLLKEMISIFKVMDDIKYWSSKFKYFIIFIEKWNWSLRVLNFLFISIRSIFNQLIQRLTIFSIPKFFSIISDQSKFNYIWKSSLFSKQISTILWVLKA